LGGPKNPSVNPKKGVDEFFKSPLLKLRRTGLTFFLFPKPFFPFFRNRFLNSGQPLLPRPVRKLMRFSDRIPREPGRDSQGSQMKWTGARARSLAFPILQQLCAGKRIGPHVLIYNFGQLRRVWASNLWRWGGTSGPGLVSCLNLNLARFGLLRPALGLF
jgi:hypothetical protein